MKCIVIDDEPLARQGMDLLIKEVSDLELTGSFSNIMEADQFLRNNQVSLIFLDIQMPLMSGIDFLKVNPQRPMVIITTAYPQYAIEGFEFDVIDYLTKPIRFERFYKAVTKCFRLNELYNLKLSESNISETEQIQTIKSDDDSLFVRSNRKYVKVFLNKIRYIEALKDYVIIYHLTEKIPVSINLKSIEGKLPVGKFIRVNKSFIVNTDFIKSFESDLISLDNIEVTIGDKYRENVLKFLLDERLIKRDY